MNPKQKIRDSFSAYAEQYHQEAHLQKVCAECLVDQLSDIKGNILEIGCGTGFVTEKLIKKFPSTQILATDLSESMLRVCQTNIKSSQVTFKPMDGEHIPNNEKYDLIISGLAFQWFLHFEQSIKNLLQTLKPGGLLNFSFLHSTCFPEWQKKCVETNLPFFGTSLPCAIKLQKAFPSMQIKFHSIPIVYKSPLHFFKSLKKIGAGVSLNEQNFSVGQFKSLLKQWDSKEEFKVTYEVAYCSVVHE
jgi:malonyl-CoA O-methyltransferase